MRQLVLALTFAIGAGPALADEAALLIGNSRYDTLDRVRGADRVSNAATALERGGVGVLSERNADRDAMLERLREFSQRGRSADGLAVVLAGRLAFVGETAWLLPVDAEGVGVIDAAAQGIPLALVTELLRGVPGRGILVLGSETPDPLRDIELPAGVTLVVTDPRGAFDFAEDVLAEPGASIAEAEDRDLTIDGFVTRRMAFLEEGARDRPDRADSDAEANYWRLTQQRDDLTAYRAYLDRYPQGRFRAEAQDRIDALTETPEDRAARAESALGLTRSGRLDVQRDLSVLGYDTRGIDGIFGPGTRGALRGWQNANGFAVTGYLTQEQLDELDEQGRVRAAALEEEEERRRAEMRREDNRAWAALGDRKTRAELQGYLDRFPDGLHANEARRLISQMTDGRPDPDTDGPTRRERQVWRVTQQENTVQGYRAFLEAFPDGRFSDEARAAIDRLTRADTANAEAEAAERALGLTPLTRRAVEQRLSALGLDPGRVDGQFDASTRSALRRYQQSAGLPQTGYVNQITAVRLLADALRGVLQ